MFCAAVGTRPTAVPSTAVAAARFARETPVFTAGWLSRALGGEISLKAENLQRTGSFKVRGVAVKLEREPAGAAGVAVSPPRLRDRNASRRV